GDDMDQGIGNWVSMQARRSPGRAALVDASAGGAVLTYGQFESRTNALADALRARGVRKGDRVAIMALNSPQFLEVAIAVAKLGAIRVPTNCRLAPPEARYVLDDAAPGVLFASPQTAETASEAAAGSLVRELVEIPSAAQRLVG